MADRRDRERDFALDSVAEAVKPEQIAALEDPDVTCILADLQRVMTTLEARKYLVPLRLPVTVTFGEEGNGQPEQGGDRLAFSAREVAERLGRPVSYVRALCRARKIRGKREGKEWVIPAQAIQEWASLFSPHNSRVVSPSDNPSMMCSPSPRLGMSTISNWKAVLSNPSSA